MKGSKKKQNRFLSSAVAFVVCLSMLTEPMMAADSSGGSAPAKATTVNVMGEKGEFEGYAGMGDGSAEWRWYDEGTATLHEDDDANSGPTGKYLQIKGDGSVKPIIQGFSTGEVSGGKGYILTFYVKKNTADSPVVHVYEGTEANGTKFGNAIVSVKATDAEQGEWTKYTQAFTTAPDTARLRIRVAGGTAADDFCIDGIAITENDGSIPVPTEAPINSDAIMGDKGDFEAFAEINDPTTGWGWVKEGTATLCDDDDAKTDPTGKYLRIQGNGSEKPGIQSFSTGEVTGNTEYILMFYVKKNTTDSPIVYVYEGTDPKGTKFGDPIVVAKTTDAEQGEWTKYAQRLITASDTARLRIRVFGGSNTDDFCIDGITIVKDDGSMPVPTIAPTPVPTPVPTLCPTTPPEFRVDLLEGTGDFDERTVFKDATQWRWAGKATEGVAEYVPEFDYEKVDPADESPAKGVYLRITGSGRDKDEDGNIDKPAVRWYSRNNVIQNGATYKLTLYIRRNSDHFPYITVMDKYQSNSSNLLASVYTEGGKTNPDKNQVSVLGDKDVPKGVWQKIECQFTTKELANKLFITVYGNDVEACFDIDGVTIEDVAPSSFGYEYVKWTERLAAEEENGMLAEVIDDPTIRLEPIDGIPNLLKNGDFKIGVANWYPNTTSSGLYQFAYWGTGLNEELDGADDIIGPEGIDGVFMEDGSVQIYPNDSRDPAFGQKVESVEGGAEYQITFNYKIDKGSDARPYVDIECFTNNPEPGEHEEGYLGGVNAEWPAEDYIADGKWHSFTYRLNIGQRIDWVEFFIRQHQGSNGNVYFDDCTFSKTGGAAKVALNADMKFFYTDMQSESTEFEATVDTTYYPDYKDGRIVFQVYKDKDIIWESEKIAIENNKAKATFPLSLLTEKDRPYCVVARLYMGDEMVADDGRNIYMYDRPSSIDENGRFVKFGEDFVPVLGYHVKNGEDPVENAKVAEINVNVIQCGYGKRPHEIIAELDLLHETGQKGLVCLYTNMLPAGHEDIAVRTIEIVSNETIKNHPALFGYNIMDEPFVHMLDPRQDMENTYRLIRQYDQDNVLCFVEAMEVYAYETSAYTDALITNPYWPAAGANVYKDAKLLVDSLNFKKPVWGLYSTYTMDGRKTEGKGHFNTGDDVRNNNYQGLLAGTVGYGYFSLSDAGNVEHQDLNQIPEWANITWAEEEGYIPLWKVVSPTDPEAGAKVWQDLIAFEEKEVPIIAPYFIEGKGTEISEEINIDAGYMYHSWKAEDGTDYMVVLNVKGADVHVDIPVEKAYAEIVAGREDDQFKAKDGMLKLDLKNVEALLLRLTDTPVKTGVDLWVVLLGACVILVAAGGYLIIRRRKVSKEKA